MPGGLLISNTLSCVLFLSIMCRLYDLTSRLT